ncbi:MAG: DegT/DnrJ/EryC1/StrS family aminotransferase [Victivallales bacterium]|nr:DegT/DnrJ/EryC1/StrS family aminotransferase [Victivallales bacterium]
MNISELAINGGKPVRTAPFPRRCHVGNEEKAAVDRLFDKVIAGEAVINYNGLPEKQYEDAFVEYMGGGFADGVNSGSNAVFCAIGALNLEPFSEIIVPPITDPGGCMPVLFNACVPVCADSDTNSFNTNAAAIEKCITERTKAIIVAHIFGEPVDMDPIMEVAKKHGLYVIEDCSQAHGARYKGRLVGSIGDIAAFSTMSGKHHCTGGQGGVVYTRNEALHWEGRRFADRGKPFGLKDATYNVRAGLNCNLNDLSAVIGVEQLKKLPSIVERRNVVGEAVRKAMADNPCVKVGWLVDGGYCSYWYLRMTVEPEHLTCSKMDFCNALSKEGIPLIADYGHIQCEKDWFVNQKTFGNFGFPWQCAEYKGDRHPVFDFTNAHKVVVDNFLVVINESYTAQDTADIIAALNKVSEAFAK